MIDAAHLSGADNTCERASVMDFPYPSTSAFFYLVSSTEMWEPGRTQFLRGNLWPGTMKRKSCLGMSTIILDWLYSPSSPSAIRYPTPTSVKM